MLFKNYLIYALKFRNYSSLALNIKEILSQKPINKKILVQGWVQSIRKHKNLYFVDVFDGSCLDRLQVVIEDEGKSFPNYMSSVKIDGELVKSNHKGQEVELHCKTWKTLGLCSEEYPYQSRIVYTPEYIRQFLHLRPKTKTFSSILRIRNSASLAIHQFFQDEGFCLIHAPILTANDCEGAGEVFSIKTNKKGIVKPASDKDTSDPSKSELTEAKHFFDIVEEDDTIFNKCTNLVNENEFFGCPVYLTVSSQLHLEATASALSKVYSFGPVFRAESSHSRQHASEFHMIEAEVAFANTVESLIKVVESCIKFTAKQLLNNCSNEIHWLNNKFSSAFKDYLEKLIAKPFISMTYAEALNILKSSKHKFRSELEWGKDFALEHKNYLLKYSNNVPVIVTMFPAAMKPFYMKQDSNGLAFCFDIFAPFGGEICGGSLREDSEEVLQERLKLLGIQDTLSWYIDLRKYGGVPTGGFGIGFDRLLQSILGISNIRDVIPFPRRASDCKC